MTNDVVIELFKEMKSEQNYKLLIELCDMAIQALQTDIVRCGECKHRHNDEYCPMYGLEWHEEEDDEGFFTIEDLTKDDGYCSMGERKESEENKC